MERYTVSLFMFIKRVLAGIAFGLASAVTSSAFAHAKLRSSDPQAGSTLGAAPTRVRLVFNEALVAMLTGATVSRL